MEPCGHLGPLFSFDAVKLEQGVSTSSSSMVDGPAVWFVGGGGGESGGGVASGGNGGGC